MANTDTPVYIFSARQTGRLHQAPTAAARPLAERCLATKKIVVPLHQTFHLRWAGAQAFCHQNGGLQ
jgi:hypothetical protein